MSGIQITIIIVKVNKITSMLRYYINWPKIIKRNTKGKEKKKKILLIQSIAARQFYPDKDT